MNTMQALQAAAVGDRVRFAEEAQRYTIQARDDRYLICTKPFNPKRTVLYTIVDLRELVRGPDNLIFGMGYETREDCEDRLADLHRPEMATEISHRRRIGLGVIEVTGPGGGSKP